MSNYIQTQFDNFICKDDITGIKLGNDGVIYFYIGDTPETLVTVRGHYATIARKELGLDRLAEENAMTIQCLEAIDKFVAWWREQEGTLFDDEGRRELIEKQLALIPPQPSHFFIDNIVLEELGGRDEAHPYGDDNRVMLLWRDGWRVQYAYQRPNSTYWAAKSQNIASYVYSD